MADANGDIAAAEGDIVGAGNGAGNIVELVENIVERVVPRAEAFAENTRFNKNQEARILDAVTKFGLSEASSSTALNLVVKLYWRRLDIHDIRRDKLLRLAAAFSIQVQ